MGLTFDTGALIGIERARHRMRKVFDTAIQNNVPIVVPAVVVAEWWRVGLHEKFRAQLLRALIVDPITERVARIAGAALTRVPKAQAIDALVVASASQRAGDTIYTSDPKDLRLLCSLVPEFSSLRIEEA